MSKLKQKRTQLMQAAKTQMTENLKLPKELVNGDSIITLRGKSEVFIENYRGILECSKEFVWVSTKHFRLSIRGKDLSVAYYTNDEMKVVGTIEDISFME